MTVAELIEFLKKQPQDLLVGYNKHSEHILMEEEEIIVKILSDPRNDGWLHDVRPGRFSQSYLIFPGN